MSRRQTEFARHNRRNPTWAEAMVWADLRGRQMGYKFRRQQPIGPYIVDFVCFEKRLIVEIDGWSHHLAQNWQGDRERLEWLEAQGFTVLRFDDNEVRADRATVANAIYITLQSAQESW